MQYKFKNHIFEKDISEILWAFLNRKRFKYTVS